MGRENTYLEARYKEKLDNIYGKKELTHTQKLANFIDALEQDIFEAEEIVKEICKKKKDTR